MYNQMVIKHAVNADQRKKRNSNRNKKNETDRPNEWHFDAQSTIKSDNLFWEKKHAARERGQFILSF